jgi:hypothetical protein
MEKIGLAGHDGKVPLRLTFGASVNTLPRPGKALGLSRVLILAGLVILLSPIQCRGGVPMKTNYLAVVVSAVAYWMLGALWYGVLFSARWMTLEGITVEKARSVNLVFAYLITLVMNLLIAFVLAQVCIWRNANTAARGAAVGVLLWVGIVGPIVFTTYTYEIRPIELFAINEFYPLVGLCMMGAIVGAWTKSRV